VPAEPLTREKRDHRRQRVLKAGTIAFDGAGIDCVVRNLSATGAALEVESQIGIPSTFYLVIAAARLNRRCRVRWRKQKRLGVVFESERPVHDAPPLAPARDNEANSNPLAKPVSACIRSGECPSTADGTTLDPNFHYQTVR
jgi:PilZ domain